MARKEKEQRKRVRHPAPGGFGGLEGEADGAHQVKGVAALGYSGRELVVEVELVVFEAVFEMEIAGLAVHVVGHSSEGQVVSGEQADGIFLDEDFDDGFSADAAIVRIGAAEKLVEKKQDGQRTLGEFDH